MLTYLFSLIMLRRFARPIRIVLAVFLIGLFIVVLIYTANLFLTLPERTRLAYVYTLAIR
jgi:hypothetical protein